MLQMKNKCSCVITPLLCSGYNPQSEKTRHETELRGTSSSFFQKCYSGVKLGVKICESW